MKNKNSVYRTRRDFLKKASTITAATTTGLALNLEIPTLKATQEKKPRYAMLIDLRKCYGCRACTIACKSEFNVPLGVFRSCVQQKDKGNYPSVKRHFLPLLCNHCANPPCVEVCPVEPVKAIFKLNGKEIEYEKKATYQRPDGAVLVDYERCIGCQLCVEECPYKARYVDPIRKARGAPENNTVGKCTLCIHRVDQGVVPSCVNTCPAQARIFGDINDPKSEISKLLKEHKTAILLPEEKTNPNVFYIAFEEGIYEKYEKGGKFHDEIK